MERFYWKHEKLNTNEPFASFCYQDHFYSNLNENFEEMGGLYLLITEEEGKQLEKTTNFYGLRFMNIKQKNTTNCYKNLHNYFEKK